jgi:hypothetical protein
MDCRLMEPIVHGLTKRYAGCMTLERVNFHAQSAWYEKINPLGTPEFALVDAAGKILYRWSGFTEAESFDQVLQPLCKS